MGASLDLYSGKHAVFAGAEKEREKTTVYNLEVDGTHTYFVGERGVWVHNECGATNSAGKPYPNVAHPGTGEPIAYPGDFLTKVSVEDRVSWSAQDRGAFIRDWYDHGFDTPEGGWGAYDIHHITPREYGGGNDFDNLVPVERSIHQNQFNAWWRDY